MVALTAAACAFHVLEPAIDTWHGMGKLVVPVGLRRVASPSLALAGLGLGGMGGRCASCLRRRAHSQILYCTACMVARACDRWDGTAQRSHGRIGTPPAIGRRRVGVQVTVHACTWWYPHPTQCPNNDPKQQECQCHMNGCWWDRHVSGCSYEQWVLPFFLINSSLYKTYFKTSLYQKNISINRPSDQRGVNGGPLVQAD
jgi:hypothetical protein